MCMRCCININQDFAVTDSATVGPARVYCALMDSQIRSSLKASIARSSFAVQHMTDKRLSTLVNCYNVLLQRVVLSKCLPTTIGSACELLPALV